MGDNEIGTQKARFSRLGDRAAVGCRNHAHSIPPIYSMNMNTNTTIVTVVAAILWLWGSALCQAGFQFPGGWDGHTLGDGTNSEANKEATKGTKAKLGALINQRRAAENPPKPPLAGAELTAAQDAAFDAVRCNVKQMVDIIACQLQTKFGDDAAKCARDMFAKGRVCIDFGNAGQGGQWGDTTTAWDKDLLNLNVDLIPLTKVPCWAPPMWVRMMTLYEEMRHAMQDWSPVAGALPGREWAARQLKAVCNERDVDDESIPLGGSMCAGLSLIASGAAHGQTDPLLKKILDKIAALGPGTRAAIALALKGAVAATMAFDADTRSCYDAAKTALKKYITDGTMTDQQIKDELKKIRWQIPGQTSPPAQPMTGHFSTAANGDIKEVSGETESTIPSGLSHISDLRYDATGRYLLAIGTVAGGFGAITLLDDADGDRSFVGATPELVIPPTTALHDGCSFVPGDTAPFIVFDPTTQLIRRLTNPDGRGIPTVLGPAINAPSPLLDLVVTLRQGTDGEFYGFETQPRDGNYTSIAPITVVTDADGDGFFENASQELSESRLQYLPAPLKFAHGGSGQLMVHAMASSQLLLHPVGPDGELLAPIGNTFLPPGLDTTTMATSRPLVPGETLVLFDPERNLRSVPFIALAISLADWRLQHFGLSVEDPALEPILWGHLADPDSDGVPNILEFSLGSSPVNASHLPATEVVVPGSTSPIFVVTRRALDPDVTFVPEVSSSLLDFEHTLLEEHSVTPLPGGMERVEYLYTPGTFPPSVFFRMNVRADAPPPPGA